MKCFPDAGQDRALLPADRHLSAVCSYFKRLRGIAGLLLLLGAASLGLGGCSTAPVSNDLPGYDTRHTAGKDVWTELSRQFAIPLPTEAAGRARVQRYVDFYLLNSNIVTVSLERSEPWAEYLLSELKRRNLPGELFLVPLIESGFSARATSPSGAAGIWQFMPATGAHYGLRQTTDFDGRRDVFASTDAALDYLESLYNRFGDWQLVLAAFNYGQGNVARAMEANQLAGRKTDYWSLQLSSDAMGYVPKILALRQILESRRIQPPAYRPENAVVGIPVDASLDLHRVAGLTNVSLDDLRNLNPATRTTELPTVPGTRLAIPRTALADLARHDPRRINTRDPIESARAGLLAKASATRSQRVNTPVPARHGNALREHIVQQGETLWGIAARHHVDLGELGEINTLPRGAILSPGQRLMLPAPQSPAATQQFHRIQPGDTLNAIARLYGVTLDALREANHIPGELLRVGETLAIPARR